MKKTQAKRQRIPRRGPGVAELEKILKEQEGGAAGQGLDSSITQFQDISPPPPSNTHPLSLNPPQPPPPPPPPPLVPVIPRPSDYASWSNNLPLFPTLEFIPPPLPTTAAAAAASAKKPLLPTTRISDAQLNFPPHFFPSYQYSASSLNLEYYNSMVNINPGSASSCPSATSSAARYFRQIEHPSSQISTDFNNIWTSPEEQEKMVSAKRVRSFLEESQREPNLESRGPIFTNTATKDSSSSSSSSMEINHSPFNFDSNFRGTKRGFAGQLMSSTKRSGSYQLAESNLMALGSSSSSAPNEIAAFNIFHLPQETMEASQHRDEGGGASDYYKVTFNSSSLYESNSNSKGNKEIAISSGAGVGVEAETEGIDLNLKL